MVPESGEQRTALVLSGGGTRGAYEAGVLHGIAEILRLRPEDSPPFSLFTGTSVGALNAGWLASHAQRGDLDVDGLVALWRSLEPGEIGRIGLGAWTRRGLLDPSPLERIVREGLDERQLAENIERGRVHALVVPALHVNTGRTVVFVHATPGLAYTPSTDPRRIAVPARITADHVLASAAIPGLFPPRTIEGRLFYDGGLRFNTPIAPAIRCGATKLVVVSPLYQAPVPTLHGTLADLGPDLFEGVPDVRFLAGKMLDAVLLDPVVYDVQVVQRFNEVLHLLDQTLAPEERKGLDEAWVRLRGAPYRKLDLLVISPSEDIGLLGVRHFREHRLRLMRSGLFGMLLALGAGHHESDLVSYVLFDGRFAERLMDLGRRDALARSDEIRRFFGA